MTENKPQAKTFTHSSVVPAPMNEVLSFYASQEAFQKLAMPPMVVRIRRDGRTSLTAGELDFTMWFGPVPVRWLARHEAGPTPTSFKDTQVAGPLARWEHEHLFESIEGGVRMTDRVTFAHRSGWRGLLTRLFFDGLPLRIFFAFRHWRTRRLVSGTAAHSEARPV